jgi:hypothetical protein
MYKPCLIVGAVILALSCQVAVGSDTVELRLAGAAKSSPQQVEVFPTFDAQAEAQDGVNYVITDGGTLISASRFTSIDLQRRGILEFNVIPFAQGYTIQSATLELDVMLISSGGGMYPGLELHGYAGNGAADVSDATVPFNAIGNTGLIFDTGIVTADLDAAFIRSLLGSATHLGLMAYQMTVGRQAGFCSTEGEIPGSFSGPKLTIEYVLNLTPGDTNGDGRVDGSDYTVWADNYLNHPLPAWEDGGWEYGNFNDDDIVEGSDYTIWADNYTGWDPGGGASGGPLTVPEPGTLVLLGGAAAILFRRRRQG